MTKRADKVTFGGGAITLIGNEIKVGDKAPEFSALTGELKPILLSDFDEKVKIISVYPSIDTGVCAAQAHRFNKEAAGLEEVQIISISADLPFALRRFCGAEGIDNLLTVSDHRTVEFGEKYGFLIEELRLLTRGVVVIDKNNTVQYVEYVPEITNEPNFDAVLEAARKLI